MRHSQLFEPVPAPKFPGQRELNVLSKEQVRALASPVKQQVYFTYGNDEPMSAADVGKEIGKSAQTVRYHTNELLALDLLLEVGVRKRRSREEALYVHKGMMTIDQGAEVDDEYNANRTRGFLLECKKMGRETALFYKLIQQDPSLMDFGMWRKTHLRLKREDAAELRRRFAELLHEFRERSVESSEDGYVVNAVAYMRPTEQQTKLLASEYGIDLKTELAEDD
jgi:hypothetical protein